MKEWSVEAKVGLFALAALIILAFITLRVSERGGFGKGTYPVYVDLTSAEGLTYKTPVEVAGIQVGYIDTLELVDSRTARLRFQVGKNIEIPVDSQVQVKTKGFLGETYIDITPGQSVEMIAADGQIVTVNPFVDLSQLTSDVHEILSGENEDSLKQILHHIAIFSKNLSDFSEKNHEDWDRIVQNLTMLSSDLRQIVHQNQAMMNATLERIANVARKIDEGQGTLGKLINDDETIDNLNQTLKGINETIGGVSRFRTDFGYHIEYLGVSNDFKNYVSLALKPRPDKYFLLEFIVDPNPSPDEWTTTTDVTTGGTTTTVVSDVSKINRDKFLFSAQLAKKFHDFTFRGGVIESHGGLGIDYDFDFFEAQFSAFDFRTNNGQRPHLKALGKLNLTKNIYLVSGVDDIINPNQAPDWFVGAGFQMIDDDIRSLFGAVKLSP